MKFIHKAQKWFKRIYKILLIILFIIFQNLEGYSAEAKQYIFGVVPQFQPNFIFNNWNPVLKELSKHLNATFELVIYPSIPEFEKAFLSGKFDFAFVNPYHAVMAWEAQRYEPILRDEKPLTGILVVRKDSPIKDVKELDNATIAFPAPNAFAASLYMRAILIMDFKISFTPKYVKTHDNVYRHVLLGLVPAGGGVNNTFERQPKEVKEKLRILYETPGVAPHPIIVHPRVDREFVKAFTKVFMELAKREDLKEYFNAIQIPNPRLADYKRDYLPLKRLKIEKFVVLE